MSSLAVGCVKVDVGLQWEVAKGGHSWVRRVVAPGEAAEEQASRNAGLAGGSWWEPGSASIEYQFGQSSESLLHSLVHRWQSGVDLRLVQQTFAQEVSNRHKEEGRLGSLAGQREITWEERQGRRVACTPWR